MHSVLTDLCTGCELCIPPCPVDCIDLVEDTQPILNSTLRIAEQDDLRRRYYAHIQREEKRQLNRKGPVVRAEIDTELFAQFSSQTDSVPAIEVVEKQNVPTINIDAKKRELLDSLSVQLTQLQGA